MHKTVNQRDGEGSKKSYKRNAVGCEYQEENLRVKRNVLAIKN